MKKTVNLIGKTVESGEINGGSMFVKEPKRKTDPWFIIEIDIK